MIVRFSSSRSSWPLVRREPSRIRAATPSSARPQPVEDSLGRRTPRGTVRGFLSAARKGDDEIAAQYLNTLQGDQAKELAHQLFIVLDRRLPARPAQLSAEAEGSRADPLKPNLELIGTVPTAHGDVAVTLERVKLGTAEDVWLFSRQTLEAVPEIYREISLVALDKHVPEFLTRIRVAGVRLFDWLTVLGGLPLLYLLTVVLNRLLSPLIAVLWRRLRRTPGPAPKNILPIPVRLLLLATAIRWLASSGCPAAAAGATDLGDGCDGPQRRRHRLAADAAERPGRACRPKARARTQRGGRGTPDPAGKASHRLDCAVRSIARAAAKFRLRSHGGAGRSRHRRHRHRPRRAEDAGERDRGGFSDRVRQGQDPGGRLSEGRPDGGDRRLRRAAIDADQDPRPHDCHGPERANGQHQHRNDVCSGIDSGSTMSWG